MAEVFVSYASADRDNAFRIASFLEGEGISCWIAPRDVPPGMEYGAAILQGIETSRALVLVLSEESNDSQFVRKEVERAVSKAKPVLPVRIREVTPSGSLEFFISSSQWVDAWRSPMEQHLTQLAAAIRAIGGAPGAPVTGAKLQFKSRRTLSPMLLGIAAAAVALAVVIGLFVWKPWLPAWQRSPTAFLAGSWCQPMSGEALARTDLVKASGDQVSGSIHYSHASRIDRFRARVKMVADGYELVWLDPAELTSEPPLHYHVVDDANMTIVPDPKDQAVYPPMTRCPANSGEPR